MTQEEKELLWKDIFARIPYGVKFRFEIDKDKYNTKCFLSSDGLPSFDELWSYWMGEGYVLPYLRTMSSMTEEERIEFTKLFYKWHDDELFDYIEEGTEFSIWKHKGISPVVFDWLNSHHFDYRSLIEKGLAIEAPEGMYKF